MTRVCRAKWILPINQPPIDGGWIEFDDERIVAIGAHRPCVPFEDLGDVALVPGLVNAHTHLELSHLAGLVQPSNSMAAWIGRLIATRNATPPNPAAVARAAEAMAATGTVLIGDISNTLTTSGAIVAAGLEGIVFHELIGFQSPNPEGAVREAWGRVDALKMATSFSVVAHAPYSVSPALFRAIVAARRSAPLTVHLGESVEEIEFLETGTGPIRRALETLGVWTDAWPVPACDPVEYLARLGYLLPGCLVVHGVQLTDDALARLVQADAVMVTCPRSNIWVGSGPAPISRFHRAGLRVAIGTDSLASSDSLNLFDELAAARRAAPDVPARWLLESATRVGAEALGRDADFGTFEAGKRAAIVAVEVRGGVNSGEDVEEYLVSGVPASGVSRMPAADR